MDGGRPADERPAYGSIIERHRGTTFAAPEPPPPPSRGWSDRLAPIGLGLLALAFLVGAVAMLVGGSGTPAATPSPAAAGTPAAPTGSPSPTPWSAYRTTEALWALIRSDDPSYHVVGKGKVNTPDHRQSFTLVLDVAGDDYAGTVDTVGGSGHARLIRKDGVVYVKPDGRPWAKRRTDDPTLRQSPLLGLEAKRDLGPGELVTEGDRTLVHYASGPSYAPSVARMLDLAMFGVRPSAVWLDLWVTEAGVPVRATFRCEGGGERADGSPWFVGSATYTFTKVGKPVSVRAPKT